MATKAKVSATTTTTSTARTAAKTSTSVRRPAAGGGVGITGAALAAEADECAPPTPRTFRATGPVDLRGLTFYNDYFEYGEVHIEDGITWDGRNAQNPTQVPKMALPLMEYNNSFAPYWSERLVSKLIRAATVRKDFSPPDYRFAVLDMYDAFERYPVKDQRVLVAGSISPWVEAILLTHNASKVITSDYNYKACEHSDLEVVLVSDMEGRGYPKFDAIVSFSSIEHDGLGRYGDPLDPRGDFAAMVEFGSWLKPGGLLYLGVPVCCGDEGAIFGNGHRMYGEKRLAAMFEAGGFEVVHLVDTHWGKRPWDSERPYGKWRNQPIFIAKKVKEMGLRSPWSTLQRGSGQR